MVDDAPTTYADVVEAVRAAIATYTHALDDGRTDDVVATYWPDGVFDATGVGTFAGHDELRGAYAKWKPRAPQRHLVLNTLVSDWSADAATAVSDVVLIGQSESGWSVQFVARYTDTLGRDGTAWKFRRRVVS